MKPLSQTREAIIEEFEDRFGAAFRMTKDGTHMITDVSYIQTEQMKIWLTQALSDYTQIIIELVEGKKKELNEHPYQTGIGAGLSDPIRTYNQALDDIKEELGK